MKLSTAVQQFLADARVGLSRSSQANYASDLNLLVALATFHASDSVFDFNGDLVRYYFRELSKKGLTMATLHRRRASLNMFAKWGLRRRLWAVNPMDEAPKIKRPKRLPRPYTPDEHERLMALPLTGAEAVFRGLLAYAGLRVTEACTLQIGNVRLGRPDRPGALRILGKGNKERIVPVVPELDDLLRDWMLAAGDLLDARAPFVQQRSGRPWTRRMVEQRTAAWGEVARVASCIPHRFRHSFATMMLERGATIREVQEALGHEDIATTALYLQVVNQALVDAVMRLSPRLRQADRVTGPGSVPPGGAAS
jgi:integrase/recombinase XerC